MTAKTSLSWPLVARELAKPLDFNDETLGRLAGLVAHLGMEDQKIQPSRSFATPDSI